jgi:N-acetylmuramoyl-L-alanine amidase
MKSLLLAVLIAPGLYAQPYQEKIVAAVLAAEASSDGVRGMKAVAEVIQQRAKEKGKTPFQVVMAGKAFSCLNRISPERLYQRWSSDSNYDVALRLAAILHRQPERLGVTVNRATHYTRRGEKPYWAIGQKPVAVVGHHAFYRLNAY